MLKPRNESEYFFRRLKRNIIVFTVFTAIGFSVITLRLLQLQVAEHETLSNRADNNRIRKRSLNGMRGKIFDRNGVALVDNRPSYEVFLIPEDTKDPQRALAILAARMKIDPDEILSRMKKSIPFEPVMIKRDISRADVAFVEERRNSLPGIHLSVRPTREYIHGDMAPHLFGYLGVISKAQLDDSPPNTYSRNDYTGRYGVEKIFEPSLRGGKGAKIVEVDAAGRQLNLIDKIPPKSGSDLYLTIDYPTQVVAEKAFAENMGAAVAIDPNNGDILAIVSKPSFDPNSFAFGISSAKWKKLLNDPDHPLQNRVTQGQYPPGSTFKVVVATAGLEEGVIDKETTSFCPGYFTLGNRSYRCWRRGGHGEVNLHKAIVESCDVYFYRLGVKLGVNTIAKYAKLLGLGTATGSGMESEKGGLIPTTEWKERARKEKWIPGETVSCAIGQGYVLATPLQLAKLAGAFANWGRLPKPNIVKKVLNDGALAEPKPDSDAEQKAKTISVSTLSIIRAAMLGVVHDKGGTGARLARKNRPWKYAGKTGTSQVVRMRSDGKKKKEIPFKFRDHSLFIAFAPFNDPKIAVAVVAEHAGHGSAVAAPIAGKIIDAYLYGLQEREKLALAKLEKSEK